MKELVSVVMPHYNTNVDYLEKAINSIMQQDYDNIEFIIVDDRSEQKYWNALCKLVDGKKNVLLLRNEENLGVAYTLNVGLREANGKYIFRMDADDISLAKRISTSVKYMDSHPHIDIAGTAYRYMINNKVSPKKPYMYKTNNDIKTGLLWGNVYCHPTVCFRKSFIEKFGIEYFTNEKSEDYGLWVRCAKLGASFGLIDEVLYLYRVHENQVTYYSTNRLKESSYQIRENFFKSLGINLDKRQYEVYNEWAFDLIRDSKSLKQGNEMFYKVIGQVPEEYVNSVELSKCAIRKFIRRHCKLAILGYSFSSSCFLESEMGKRIRMQLLIYIFIKILCVFGIISSWARGEYEKCS